MSHTRWLRLDGELGCRVTKVLPDRGAEYADIQEKT